MIALQLQQESRENPNLLEDVQLHARLLLQHQRETNGFHDIFFKYTSQQRMAIIRCDREIQAQKKFRQPEQSPGSDKRKLRNKRISAVTMAKIQQKQQIQSLMSSTGSPQMRKMQPLVKHTSSSRTGSGGLTRRSLNFEGPSTASSLRSSSSMS